MVDRGLARIDVSGRRTDKREQRARCAQDAGRGGRQRLHLALDGAPQPPCPSDPVTGLIACDWAPSYQLTIPDDWTSGVYLALLTNAAGYQNYVMFVVRDDRPAAFLYQQSIATDEAYNNYPADGQPLTWVQYENQIAIKPTRIPRQQQANPIVICPIKQGMRCRGDERGR